MGKRRLKRGCSGISVGGVSVREKAGPPFAKSPF
jgi:hypothetical protein